MTAPAQGEAPRTRASRAVLHVAPIPNDRRQNPYLDLFYRALAPFGVQADRPAVYSARGLLAARGPVDVLHFHWPEASWGGGRWSRVAGVARFVSLLAVAKARGVRVVWTAHNVEPHESPAFAARVGLRALGAASDLVICHSEAARAEVHRRYRPRAETVVMPHGNYAGWYPAPAPRPDVVRAYGLDPERPVVVCAGMIRGYKGFDLAVDAVRELDGVQLVVAGLPFCNGDLLDLERRASEIPGVRIVGRSLSDQEYADLVGASDLVLLPYRKITGSGSLLSAWTLGRAVVASDLPYFREMIPAGTGAGWRFAIGDPASLAGAVREALRVPAAQRREAALAEAGRYAWATCVAPVGDVLRRWA